MRCVVSEDFEPDFELYTPDEAEEGQVQEKDECRLTCGESSVEVGGIF